MTVEEFWDKYEDGDILEIFDETCDFFSQELPQEFFDEYDSVDIILNTMGSQESAKNFDNIIKFIDLIKNKQPALYKESFAYLNDFLVEYYCFYQNASKVEEAFSLYIANPFDDYDFYLKTSRTLLYYQYSELLNRAIKENYYDVSVSDEIIDDAYDLALFKFYIVLQEAFEDKNKGFDKDDFAAQLEKYDLEFSDGLLSSFQKGLS